jgi:hypothetical protein
MVQDIAACQAITPVPDRYLAHRRQEGNESRGNLHHDVTMCDSFTLIQTAERKKRRNEARRVIHHRVGTVSHELDRYLIEKVENEMEDFFKTKRRYPLKSHRGRCRPAS